MTKADIIDSVYDRISVSRKESAAAVETIFAAMKEKLARGEKVKISGFGSFVVRHKAPRVGRNMWTKESIPIGERWSLTFKPSQILKEIINTRALSSAVAGTAAGVPAAGEAAPSAAAPASHEDGKPVSNQ